MKGTSKPRDEASRLSLLGEDIRLPFDASRFSKSRLPIRVSSLVGMGDFPTLPSCLDMLIKMPVSRVKVPDVFWSDPRVATFILTALEFEEVILPGWQKTHYAYLTVDQRMVTPGQTHRNSGWHFDGMQGSRHHPKLPACHQYVLSDRLPTEYCSLPLDATALDENKHNWFNALGDQIPDQYMPSQSNAFDVMLMSAYQMHRSPLAGPEDGGRRTFMRLDISKKRQDRLGNTINPLMPAPWEFVERKLPEGLQEPESSASWTGSQKYQGQ